MKESQITTNKSTILLLVYFIIFLLTSCGSRQAIFNEPADAEQHVDDLFESSQTNGETIIVEGSRSGKTLPLLVINISIESYIVDFESFEFLPFPGGLTLLDEIYDDTAVIYGTGILNKKGILNTLDSSDHLHFSEWIVGFDFTEVWEWSNNNMINRQYALQIDNSDYLIMDVQKNDVVFKGDLPYSILSLEERSQMLVYNQPTQDSLYFRVNDKLYYLSPKDWAIQPVEGLDLVPFDELQFSSLNNLFLKSLHNTAVIYAIEGSSAVPVYSVSDFEPNTEFALSVDGKLIAGIGSNNLVMVVDTTSSKSVYKSTITGCPLGSIFFSPDNRYLVYGCNLGGYVWTFVDLETGNVVAQREGFDKQPGFRYLFLDPDIYKKVVPSATSNTIN